MIDSNYLLLVFLVMTIATYISRLTPFIFFASGAETPVLKFIAKKIPPMVLTILVFYMLREVNYFSFEGANTIIALLATSALHFYKRNALLSILTGTIISVSYTHLTLTTILRV